MDYRAGSHSRYEMKVHLVWITKYRKGLLRGAVWLRVRELIREICKAHDVIIIKGPVSVAHVHLLVSYPPTLPVSKRVPYLKGKTSGKLLQEYGGQHLWARG
jgi:putative transposase